MPLNSRAKGAAGERELADELVSAGLMARRTVQYCGNTGDAADLVIDGVNLHVEVKRVERVRLSDWVEQARRDARGRPWCIFTRQSRQPWLVVQTFDQWIADSMTAQQGIAHVQRIRDSALSPCAAREELPCTRKAPRQEVDTTSRQMDTI